MDNLADAVVFNMHFTSLKKEDSSDIIFLMFVDISAIALEMKSYFFHFHNNSSVLNASVIVYLLNHPSVSNHLADAVVFNMHFTSLKKEDSSDIIFLMFVDISAIALEMKSYFFHFHNNSSVLNASVIVYLLNHPSVSNHCNWNAHSLRMLRPSTFRR